MLCIVSKETRVNRKFRNPQLFLHLCTRLHLPHLTRHPHHCELPRSLTAPASGVFACLSGEREHFGSAKLTSTPTPQEEHLANSPYGELQVTTRFGG